MYNTVNKWNPSEIGNHYHSSHFVIEYLDDDGSTKYDKYMEQACYAPLRSYTSWGYTDKQEPRLAKYAKAVAIHAAIVGGVMIKNMDDYLSFIFDAKRSPWCSIIPNKGLDWVSPKKDSPYVTLPITPETPAQIIFNLLFAVRLGHDIPQIVRRFNWLTEKGWSEYEALFTSVYYGLDREGKTVTTDPWSNHNAFNSNKLIDLNALEAKKPNITLPDKKFIHGYQQVTSIWDKKTNRNCDEIYNVKSIAQSYTGTFSRTFQNKYGGSNFSQSYTLNNEDILALKDEILAKGRS